MSKLPYDWCVEKLKELIIKAQVSHLHFIACILQLHFRWQYLTHFS